MATTYSRRQPYGGNIGLSTSASMDFHANGFTAAAAAAGTSLQRSQQQPPLSLSSAAAAAALRTAAKEHHHPVMVPSRRASQRAQREASGLTRRQTMSERTLRPQSMMLEHRGSARGGMSGGLTALRTRSVVSLPHTLRGSGGATTSDAASISSTGSKLSGFLGRIMPVRAPSSGYASSIRSFESDLNSISEERTLDTASVLSSPRVPAIKVPRAIIEELPDEMTLPSPVVHHGRGMSPAKSVLRDSSASRPTSAMSGGSKHVRISFDSDADKPVVRRRAESTDSHASVAFADMDQVVEISVAQPVVVAPVAAPAPAPVAAPAKPVEAKPVSRPRVSSMILDDYVPGPAVAKAVSVASPGKQAKPVYISPGKQVPASTAPKPAPVYLAEVKDEVSLPVKSLILDDDEAQQKVMDTPVKSMIVDDVFASKPAQPVFKPVPAPAVEVAPSPAPMPAAVVAPVVETAPEPIVKAPVAESVVEAPEPPVSTTYKDVAGAIKTEEAADIVELSTEVVEAQPTPVSSMILEDVAAAAAAPVVETVVVNHLRLPDDQVSVVSVDEYFEARESPVPSNESPSTPKPISIMGSDLDTPKTTQFVDELDRDVPTPTATPRPGTPESALSEPATIDFATPVTVAADADAEPVELELSTPAAPVAVVDLATPKAVAPEPVVEPEPVAEAIPEPVSVPVESVANGSGIEPVPTAIRRASMLLDSPPPPAVAMPTKKSSLLLDTPTTVPSKLALLLSPTITTAPSEQQARTIPRKPVPGSPLRAEPDYRPLSQSPSLKHPVPRSATQSMESVLKTPSPERAAGEATEEEVVPTPSSLTPLEYSKENDIALLQQSIEPAESTPEQPAQVVAVVEKPANERTPMKPLKMSPMRMSLREPKDLNGMSPRSPADLGYRRSMPARPPMMQEQMPMFRPLPPEGSVFVDLAGQQVLHVQSLRPQQGGQPMQFSLRNRPPMGYRMPGPPPQQQMRSPGGPRPRPQHQPMAHPMPVRTMSGQPPMANTGGFEPPQRPTSASSFRRERRGDAYDGDSYGFRKFSGVQYGPSQQARPSQQAPHPQQQRIEAQEPMAAPALSEMPIATTTSNSSPRQYGPPRPIGVPGPNGTSPGGRIGAPMFRSMRQSGFAGPLGQGGYRSRIVDSDSDDDDHHPIYAPLPPQQMPPPVTAANPNYVDQRGRSPGDSLGGVTGSAMAINFTAGAPRSPGGGAPQVQGMPLSPVQRVPVPQPFSGFGNRRVPSGRFSHSVAGSPNAAGSPGQSEAPSGYIPSQNGVPPPQPSPQEQLPPPQQPLQQQAPTSMLEPLTENQNSQTSSPPMQRKAAVTAASAPIPPPAAEPAPSLAPSTPSKKLSQYQLHKLERQYKSEERQRNRLQKNIPDIKSVKMPKPRKTKFGGLKKLFHIHD
ncbi:uncharacterized protein V1518DRAFT_416420 [Limtongia smithiae]|uniref:uncharacterized protein n=1 Tax=Limtongia smithiae TaxID=1125753 RepID=UPI0034CF34F5